VIIRGFRTRLTREMLGNWSLLEVTISICSRVAADIRSSVFESVEVDPKVRVKREGIIGSSYKRILDVNKS